LGHFFQTGSSAAAAVARRDADERSEFVTNLRHAIAGVEYDLGWRLIEFLDGTRDRAALPRPDTWSTIAT
jgi:hypothetical protein